jgi:3-oxosteroid 1-dehydrogenase
MRYALLWFFIFFFFLALLALLILIAIWLYESLNPNTETVLVGVPVFPNNTVFLGSGSVGTCVVDLLSSEINVDVVLVGGGISSLSAAVLASVYGLKTIIVERGPTLGGQVLYGAGTVWAPGSVYQQELCDLLPDNCNGSTSITRGCLEVLYDALAYLNRLSFPTLYNPTSPNFGLPPLQSAKNADFITNIPLIIEQWKSLGVATFAVLQEKKYPFNSSCFGSPDFLSFLPQENDGGIPVRGRTLQPVERTGSIGNGTTLIQSILEWFAVNATTPPDVLLNTRVIQLWTQLLNQTEQDPNVFSFLSELGISQLGLDWTFSPNFTQIPWMNPNTGGVRVIGVQAVSESTGKCVSIRSKFGVFLGTGGFISDPDMVLSNILGPVLPQSGGGETITNSQETGDGIVMASSLGAGTLNMQQAWFQHIFPMAAWMGLPPEPSFMIAINNAIVVNIYGQRIYDELSAPNERTRVHFQWSPEIAVVDTFYTFLIFDERALINLFGKPESSLFGMPTTLHLIIGGNNISDLAMNIDSVLTTFNTFTNGFQLDSSFVTGLELQLIRWNTDVTSSCRDFEFGRGDSANDRFWFDYFQENNPSQYGGYCGTGAPWLDIIQTNATLYAVVLGPGMRDTNGGILTNEQFQVMTPGGLIIDGLFAGGDTAGASSGQSEPGAGFPIAEAIYGGAAAIKQIAAQANITIE